MTHIYTHFGDVPLPLHRQRYQHDPMSAMPSLQRGVDSFYDLYGSGIADPNMQVMPITGIYIGEVTYLVDEAGNRFVDEAGNHFIFGDAKTMLRSQLLALRHMVRTYDVLWRARVNEQSVREWKMARFVSLRQPTNYDDLYIAEITANFETSMAYWHAEEATEYTDDAEDGVALSLWVENSSSVTIDDAVLTITQTSGTITDIAIACTELGIDLEWTGTLTTNEQLVFDLSGLAISEDAEDAYSGFEKGADHTATTWMPITPGLHLFTVTVTGGDATVLLSFYAQEP